MECYSKFCDLADCVEVNRSDISIVKFSDLLRLRLLSCHGGVWADATLFCVQPLDHIDQINKSSFLHESGCMESMKRGYPCRGDGAVLPWMNYPVITLLEQWLKNDFSVFEYGSGYATLFYARLVKNVTSVEHNDGWYSQLKKSFPASVTHRRSRKTR